MSMDWVRRFLILEAQRFSEAERRNVEIARKLPDGQIERAFYESVANAYRNVTRTLWRYIEKGSDKDLNDAYRYLFDWAFELL